MAPVASLVAGLIVSFIGALGLNAAWQSRDALELFASVAILAVGFGSIAMVIA